MAGEAAAAAITSVGNIGATMLQNRYNKQMADKQNRLNLEQWNRQNVYNSPVEQMKRLSEAGLNPNLMYTQGNVGNASGSPHLEAGQKSAPRLDFVERMAQAIQIKNAQIQSENAKIQGDLMKSQNEYNQQKILESISRQGYTNARTAGQIHNNWLLGNMVEGRKQTPFSKIYESQLQALQQDVNNKVLSGSLTLENIGLTRGKMSLQDLDKQIRQEILRERKYWNEQRDIGGIERGDNILLRSGINLGKKLYEKLDPSGIRNWINRQF